MKILKFKDECGVSVNFGWWIRWKIAKWHLRCWLRYEGMPKNLKTFNEMKDWAGNSGKYHKIV